MRIRALGPVADPTGSSVDASRTAAPSDDEDPRPHVCFLTSSAPLGPGDAYSPFILDLAEALGQRGHRVTILTPHVVGSSTRERLRGVEIRRFRYLADPSDETLGLDGGMLPGLRRRPFDFAKVPSVLLAQRRALEDLHRTHPVDLLHSHWVIPQGVVGGSFATARRIPHVTTAHGSDLLGLRFPGVGPLLRLAARRSDLLTVNSDAMRRVLQERIGEHPTRVIPIGARPPDPSVVTGNLDLRRSLPEVRHVAGFVGRTVREKGILEFVRGIASLRGEGVSVGGLVVGGGSAEGPARALAKSLGVGNVVRFEGRVAPERVPRYLSVMDVLLVPSHYEAQGIAAIEAMLMGLPVVACRTGGLAEVVLDGLTGLGAEVGSVSSLARATRRLLTEDELRRRISLEAYRWAREGFTLGVTADRFDRAYRSLLERWPEAGQAVR